APDFTVALPCGDVVPFPCAGAFLMHRDVYHELGGWDTSFFLNQEDIDLFLRSWQRRWKCVTVPQAKVYHAVGVSNTQVVGTGKKIVVGKKRYISTYASNCIICLKYFSTPANLLAAAGWLARFVNNALKLRFRFLYWDLLVLAEIARRTPPALAYRSQHAALNRSRPGQRFFTALEFMPEA